MMRKNYCPFVLLFPLFFGAQSKQSLDKVMLSKDVQEIAEFIKSYPQEPNVPFLKRRLENLTNAAKRPVYEPSASARFQNTSAVSAGSSAAALLNMRASSAAPEPSAATKKIENVINHLFNNDPTKSEAYLQVKNLSDCDLSLKIEGKSSFQLDVPRKGDNFLLVPKGNYRISGNVCHVSYSSVKELTKDTQINLNLTNKARN